MKYLIFFLCILIINGCSLYYDIKYEVTGSASEVDITYQPFTGDTTQTLGVSPPWSYSFTGLASSYVYVSARNTGDSGSVTVTIYKDGSVFKTTTSNGAHCVATAGGYL